MLGVLALLAAACGDDGDDSAPVGGPDADEAPATDDTADDEEAVDTVAPLADDVALPLVFVHGFAGSAQQYESQAMRFVANGYPQDRIVAYDHDGAGMDIAAYADGVDEVVDAALADHGAEQVYLVGHSRGTRVSTDYLEDPDRAEKVARYVAIDGAPCPEAVPCLEVTQADIPGQAHVEVATSAESFAMQYEFLVGEAPDVVDITPQSEPVELSGRAVDFPANTGRAGATLDVWRIDPDTGARVEDEPVASVELGPDGEFGPIEVEAGAHHEWALTSEESDVEHHLYLQPYVRSSHLVRLLSSPPDGDVRANTNAGDDHAALVVIRMREWYGDPEALDPERFDGDVADVLDVLEVSTRTGDGHDLDQEPVDVIGQVVGNGAIGLHLHDAAASPGDTTLDPLPYFAGAPFQSGLDVFAPARLGADGLPDGTITLRNLPRGDADRPQVLNVPNWPSSGHAISVVFADHAVD